MQSRQTKEHRLKEQKTAHPTALWDLEAEECSLDHQRQPDRKDLVPLSARFRETQGEFSSTAYTDQILLCNDYFTEDSGYHGFLLVDTFTA